MPRLTQHIESATVQGNKTILTVRCPFCRKSYSVSVLTDQYNLFINGELAQRAFKGVIPSTRESVMSGTCPKCFDREFAE